MPEACFLCLDSTEYMRNGDQYPTRLLAEQEAATLLVNAKIQMNAENTVGFLTTGGAACTVFETLTLDIDRVMATLTAIPVSGKRCHFANGLLIASLALSHRTNARSEKRIVAFVGSPLHETAKELEQLAKRLRKEEVAVDVVAFGAEGNAELLAAFIDKVNKGGNSRLLTVERGANLTDALMSSPILIGEENWASMGGDAGGGGGGGMGFAVDPNVDPELAMAIRLSMEEEERRQAAVAAVAAASGAPAPAAQPPAAAAAATAGSSTAAQAANENEEADWGADMSEDEMLRRALAMSMEEANQPPPSSAAPPAENEEGFDEFKKELEATLESERKKKDGKDEGKE